MHSSGPEADRIDSFKRIGIVAGVPRAPRRYTGAIAAGIVQAQEELAAREASTEDSIATIGHI